VDGRFWGLESNGTSYLLQNTSLSPFSFGIDHQGEVYMLASNGRIYRFSATGGSLGFESFIQDLQFSTNVSIGETILPAARGGSGSFTYSLSPTLPDGLSFDAATRAITGVPTHELSSTTFTLTATDSDGLTGSSEFKIIVETPPDQAPTVRISGIPQKINSTEPLTATFTFTKNVTGFETEDVTVTGGSKNSFSGSGKTYTLMVTPISGSDVEVKVAANAATDGSKSGPPTSQSVTAAWDATIPTVEVSGVPTKINSATPFTAGFTFSETVTGFDAIDVNVSGATKGALQGSGDLYSMEIAPNENSDVVVSVRAGAATDGLNAGPTSEQSATAIWDIIAPTVEISDLPSKINSTSEITATFTFNEAITGFDMDDVSVSGARKGAFSGSGKSYTLGVTPISGSNVVVTVLANAVTDELNTGPSSSVSATSIWDVDLPTLEISNVPKNISSNSPFTVTFTFSEAVTGFDADDVSVVNGDKGDFTASSESVYTVVVTPTGSVNTTLTIRANAATDGANSGPSNAQSITAVWVADAPTVTLSGIPPKINSKIPIIASFTFNEEVSGFETNDITVNGGAKGSFSASNEIPYQYTLDITPTGSEDVIVTVRADAASNGTYTGPTSDASMTAIWDEDAPALTLEGIPSMMNSIASLQVRFLFSEEVTGFATEDVGVTGGAKGRFSGSGKTYTLVVNPTGTENVVIHVPVNAVTDGLNPGPSTAISATAVWDATVPEVAISGVEPRINTTTAFTSIFTFTEDVMEFESKDVTVTGGNKGIFSGTGKSYSINIVPVEGSDVTVSVASNAVTDGLNRGPASVTSVTSVWDQTAPSLTITVPPKVGLNSVLTAKFTFSEDVTGFETDDIAVTGGSKGIFSGNGNNYSLSITPNNGSSVVITVPAGSVTDGLNVGPVSRTTATSVWDETPPDLTITGVPTTIDSVTEFIVTFTFSEDVNGFETGDVTVNGGTKGKFSGFGDTYTLAITPDGSTNVVIVVESNVVSDGVNTGPPSTMNVIAEWESDLPSVTIADIPSKINTTTSFTATFLFSEDVTGFEAEDIEVSGGTKGSFSGSEEKYMLEITPQGSSDVEISVAANSVTNGSNTGPAVDVRAIIMWDEVGPTLRMEGIPEKINSRTTLTAEFIFNEEVTGFETGDILLRGGNKGDFTRNGNTFTLEVVPVGSEDVVVTVTADVVTDGLNTGPEQTQSATAIWDEDSPRLTVRGVPKIINSKTSFTATFAFDEEVTGFEPTDVAVTGGTKGDFSESGQEYRLEILPTGSMDVVVTVGADVVTDGLNTGPASAVTATAAWMELIPTITINDSKATEGETLTFTVTLDRAVSGGFVVTPSFTDDTATKGEDYSENTESLTFLGIENEVHSFTVDTIDDDLLENDETFSVQLTVSGTTKEIGIFDSATGMILDNDEKSSASVLIIQGIYKSGIDLYLNDTKLLDDVSYPSAKFVEEVETGKTKLDVVNSEASSNGSPLYSGEILLVEDQIHWVILIGANANEISTLVFSEVPEEIPQDQVRIRALHGARELGNLEIHLTNPVDHKLIVEIGKALSFLDITPSVQVPQNPYNISIFQSLTQSLVDTYAVDWSDSSGRDGVLILSSAGISSVDLFVVWSNGDTYIPAVVTSTEDLPVQISSFSAGNYPNPFYENTNLWYTLEESSDVEIEVMDILGRKVFSDVVKKVAEAGSKVMNINTENWTPGVYFYRIITSSEASPKIYTGKMIRVR